MKRLIENAWDQTVAESFSGENEVTLRALRKIFFKGAIAMFAINLVWDEGVPLNEFADLTEEILEFELSLPKDVVM